MSARMGMQTTQGRSAAWHFEQHRRIENAIASLKPERKGVVDAFILSISLDSDAVFGKESAEAARVLTRRYGAVGHSLLLASGSNSAPEGSPDNLAIGLAAIAAKMNKAEDILVLYATAHGGPGIGIVYKDGRNGYGLVAPQRLATLLDELQIKRRILLISACYSGQFVGELASADSAIVTASNDDRTSFGCAPGSDWTFFGDALINTAMRKATPLQGAADEAFKLIGEWEFTQSLTPSNPRIFVGDAAKLWLVELEKHIPAVPTPKVGRPAIDWQTPKGAGR
jgi:Peptidase C13 family